MKERDKFDPAVRSRQCLEAFRDGAPIVPRNFYFVRIPALTGNPDPEACYWAETDREHSPEGPKPYDAIRMSGRVEGRFIYRTVISRHLLPYVHARPATIVLPIIVQQGAVELLTAEVLLRRGYPEFAKWMNIAETVWHNYRTGKIALTIYERLDYYHNLSSQNLDEPHLVLYQVSADCSTAAYVDRTEYPGFVVDHKMYGGVFRSSAEAHYITAILNSDVAHRVLHSNRGATLSEELARPWKWQEADVPAFNPAHDMHLRIADVAIEIRA